jgi:hypothetical protein
MRLLKYVLILGLLGLWLHGFFAQFHSWHTTATYAAITLLMAAVALL